MKRQWTCESLEKYIAELRKSSDREVHGSAYEKARSFLYGFSRFAERTCDIVQVALPTGSEYSAALAVIALFARPLNVKADKEEKILAQVDRIADLLPTLDYLRKALQTSSMMQAISEICAEIASFLYEALCYYKKPRIEKFVSSLISNYDDKFKGHVTAILRNVNTIKSLQNTALLAMQIDAAGKIDQTAKLLLEIHKASELRAANIEAKIDECMSTMTRQSQTAARIHVQNLSEALLSHPLDIQGSASTIDSQRESLPPSDLWENHADEINIGPWLQRPHRPILWLGGPQRPGRLSWVSPFIVDFLAALTLESEVNVAAVFCTAGGVDLCTVVKNLVDQALNVFPSLPLSSGSPLAIRRFRSVGTSTRLAFDILYDLLSCLESQSALWRKGFFIIIDRIDLCSSSSDCDVRQCFVPALQQLALRFAHLNVVVTSTQPAETCSALDQSPECLTKIWVNSFKPMAMRQR